MNMKLENMEMQTYLGKLERLIADYNTLMPFTSDTKTFNKKHIQFFMVLVLAGRRFLCSCLAFF